ncbi:MAG: hypothetical protein H6767_00140 [Candidatus Peribacteria bacterium]|nr:MAG: hypothetical protein H6767_00140 [Candidatus Peribacteria bacterium]
MRTGELENKICYKKGEVFHIYIDKKKVTHNHLFCDYENLIEDVKKGKNIVIDSGLFNVKVLEKKKDHLVVKALNAAEIGSRRHVNLPGVKLKLPGITRKDENDIIF